MKSKHSFLPILALCMTAASSNAATIVYTFDTATTAIIGSNTGQTATQIATTNTFGSGITAGTYSATSTVGGLGVTGGEMRAIKKGDTDTHTFTITIPNLGANTLDLTSIFFNYGTRGADTAPANFTVSSNLAGGTITPNTATHAAVANTSSTATMVLAGTFTGLNNTAITFTLADSAGGSNNSTAMYTWIDNVTLTGTVNVIPEPSAALLGGLGLLALLRRRRF